jgi:hypothetical protein
MKYVKILGLLAVAAAALMAFAGTASADQVSTTTGGAAATPTIHAVSEGGHVSLANSNANIECASTVEGTVTSHGAGKPVVGSIEAKNLTFTGCTNGWTVTTNAGGTLSVTSTGGHNGTVTSNGATVTAVLHTIFGDITCRYSTSNTHIGTVTGGNPATLKITGSIPFHSGGGLCGSGSSQWTGNYVTTSALYVAAS